MEEINKEQLQKLLESEAIDTKSKGQCNSYTYCRYCISRKKKKVTNSFGEEIKEMLNIYKQGDTPCADAYLKMEESYGRNVKELFKL